MSSKAEYFQLRAQGFSHAEAYAAIYEMAPPTTPAGPQAAQHPQSAVSSLAGVESTPHKTTIHRKKANFSPEQMRASTLADFEIMRDTHPDTFVSAFGSRDAAPWLTPRAGFGPSHEDVEIVRALGRGDLTIEQRQEAAKRMGRTCAGVLSLHRRVRAEALRR